MRNRNAANLNLPQASCFDRASCGDPACQGYLASYHQISQQDYDDMVNAFFGNTTTAVLSVAASAIDVNVDCQSHRVKYMMDENNIGDNNDVSVTVEQGYEIEGKYSIALFKGIITLYNPDTFHFSKAKEDNGNYTLAFYATANNQPVYFGDLSNLYP